jgi:voltage-gated potassium channel
LRRPSGLVLGVVRDRHLLRIGAPEVDAIEAADRLLYIRHAGQ